MIHLHLPMSHLHVPMTMSMFTVSLLIWMCDVHIHDECACECQCSLMCDRCMRYVIMCPCECLQYVCVNVQLHCLYSMTCACPLFMLMSMLSLWLCPFHVFLCGFWHCRRQFFDAEQVSVGCDLPAKHQLHWGDMFLTWSFWV